jgi:geranylgeranyl pyrophosphate synthase
LKVTLTIILLLKKTSKHEKEKINTLFQKKKRTNKELIEIIKLLQKYGIEQECREYAEKISFKSIIILNKFKNKQSQLLKELLVTSLKREG